MKEKREIMNSIEKNNEKDNEEDDEKDVEWDAYELNEYPDVENIEFPKEINIAYAVCGKSCGCNDFIVDGSSQVCQYCGKLNFRTEVRKYVLVEG